MKIQIERVKKSGVQDSSGIIKLNIGGTHEIMTTRQVLCDGPARGSKLEEMFGESEGWAGSYQLLDNKIFLDRDGKTFE